MSPVTAQGIQAAQRLREEVPKTLADILQKVDREAQSPTQLVKSVQAPADVVREAIWQLLDSGQVELTSERKIRRI